jgi:hypothetical protein
LCDRAKYLNRRNDCSRSIDALITVGHGYRSWHLYVHRFFKPGHIILMKTASNRRMTLERLVILTIETLLMPTLERSLQGKVEEIVVRKGLDIDTAYHLPLGEAGLVLQEELVLE